MKKSEEMFREYFVRSASVLVGGAAVGQVLMALALPLLTRLYTPADFSALAVYASIVGIVSVASCLRFEVAVSLPLEDAEAANLLALALCSSALISGLLAVLIALLPNQTVALFAQPRLQPYLWLLPLGIWLSCSYAALQSWVTRKKRFSVIVKTRLVQAVGGVGIQIGFGWAGLSPVGLLLGQIVGASSGSVGLACNALRNERAALLSVNWPDMKRAFFEYKYFPKYSTLESLINSVGGQFPVLIIAALSATSEAGFLVLVSRVMGVPLTLMGNAVELIYISRAPNELRAGTLGKFTAIILGGLAKTGAGPLIYAGIVSPVVFPIIFGSPWQLAGEMVAWMTPLFVMQFLLSPISMTLDVTQSQRAGVIVQIFGVILRVGAVAAAAFWAQGWIIETYAVSGFLFYLVYLYVILSIAKVKINDVLIACRPALVILASWIFLAVATRVLLLWLI